MKYTEGMQGSRQQYMTLWHMAAVTHHQVVRLQKRARNGKLSNQMIISKECVERLPLDMTRTHKLHHEYMPGIAYALDVAQVVQMPLQMTRCT